MREAFAILEAPAAHGPAPLSFDLFGSITTLYRRGLKAVHLENRGKQLRAETAISGLQRRATASGMAVFFMLVTWQSLPLPFYGGCRQEAERLAVSFVTVIADLKATPAPLRQ